MACADRMHSKQLEISNALRKAFGLALIEDAESNKESLPASAMRVGEVHILPMPFMPKHMPALESPISTPTLERDVVGFSSFIDRIHSALTELGTWEARAVAFVLGESQHQLGFHPVHPSSDNPSLCHLLSSHTFIHPRSDAGSFALVTYLNMMLTTLFS
jgi:hypothetical protein